MEKTPSKSSRNNRSKDKIEANEIDLINMYLSEIGQTPLLEPEEEPQLMMLIEKGKQAREALDQDDLDEELAQKLTETVIAGQEARERFFKANLRLVVSVARRVNTGNLTLLDAIQEGNLGLNHAIDKFDWRKGFKFSTYATWWIRQSIGRAVQNTSRIVRLPVHMHDSAKILWRTELELLGEGKEPTIELLAERSGLEPESVLKVIRAVKISEPMSLDMPLNGEEGDSGAKLGDVVAIDEAVTDFAAKDAAIVFEGLREALRSRLNPREYQVLALRYGLEDGIKKTLQEVADLMGGLSRERIRQIEQQAMTKIRHPAFRNVMKQFDIF